MKIKRSPLVNPATRAKRAMMDNFQDEEPEASSLKRKADDDLPSPVKVKKVKNAADLFDQAESSTGIPDDSFDKVTPRDGECKGPSLKRKAEDDLPSPLKTKRLKNAANSFDQAESLTHMLEEPCSKSTIKQPPDWKSTFEVEGGLDVIARNLHEYLDVGDIMNLGKTCKQLHNNNKELQPSTWNIDRKLKSHLSKPVDFRALLAQHDAAIVGVFPLAFLDRKSTENMPLDILVSTQEAKSAFISYLVTEEGYRGYNCSQPYQKRKDQPLNGPTTDLFKLMVISTSAVTSNETESNTTTVTITETDPDTTADTSSESLSPAIDSGQLTAQGIFQIQNPDEDPPSNLRRIRIIMRLKQPLLFAFYSAPTAAFLTFVTGHAAYHIMPNTTFVKRSARFNDNGRYNYNRGILASYFGITSKIDPARNRHLTSWEQHARTIGDSRSWIIPLPPVPAVRNSCTTPRALRMNSFSVYTGNIWEISYRGNRAISLQHAYSSVPYSSTMIFTNKKFTARVSAFWEYAINVELRRFDTHMRGSMDRGAWKVWDKSFKCRKQKFKKTGLNRDPGAGENILVHCYSLAGKKLPEDWGWRDAYLVELYEQWEVRFETGSWIKPDALEGGRRSKSKEEMLCALRRDK